MKTKQLHLFFSFLVLLFFCNSCTSDYSTQPVFEVDPELLGEWYYIDSSFSFPPYAFHGIQISDKLINYLGVETSSGEVKLLGQKYAKIMFANNNKLIVEIYIENYSYIKDTLRYEIHDNILTISSGANTSSYFKTKLDEKVLLPVNSNLSAKIDDDIFNNLKIFPFPSAFITLSYDGVFRIVSHLEGKYIIELEIPAFTGPGTYSLATDKAYLMSIHGDAIAIAMIDSSANNTLTIENYNEIENVCSGKFHFSFPADEGAKPRVVDGLFSVPVYR